MGYMCDFCSDRRSMDYCRSDDACLCLDCDTTVHAANSLSRRHSRNLVCQRCNSQPAVLQCTGEKISLCQDCDWTCQSTEIANPAQPKLSIPGAANSTADDDLYLSFDMDEGDLNIQNYEELFLVNLGQSEEFLKNIGIRCLFELKDKSLAELDCHGTLESQPIPLSTLHLISIRFEKTLRYVFRKERADVRKRVKGRFGQQTYDYDSLSQTKSC